jgi:uncharacterized protein (UPF0548 family)
MRFVRPADIDAIDRLVEDLGTAEPTYAEIGVTLNGQRPTGFRIDHYETELGQGAETFNRAVQGLQTWEAHHQVGIKVFPDETEIRPG